MIGQGSGSWLRAVLPLTALVTALLFAGPASASANVSKLFANAQGAAGVETVVFTVGDRIYSNGAVDNGRFGRVLVQDGSGATRFSSPCTAATAFNVGASNPDGPPRYTFSSSDPVSTSAKWKYTVQQFNESSCSGAPANVKALSFSFAKATAYADAALTTPKSTFAAGDTVYVRVDGFKEGKNDLSTTWIDPSGLTACARTTGAERADSSPTGVVPDPRDNPGPAPASDGLQYPPRPPDGAKDNWNFTRGYKPACPALDTSDDGTWELKLQGDATQVTTLSVFTVSNIGPVGSTPTPPAPPGTFTVPESLPGVALTVDTNGGLWPDEVRVTPANGNMSQPLATVLAGPAVDISAPAGTPQIAGATLTLPYADGQLPGVAEGDLRIYSFDPTAQLWVPVPGAQTVNAAANTVTAHLTHFSVYAVLGIRTSADWAAVFGKTPVRCVASSSVGIDVAFVVDSSGSMSSNDPSGKRVDAAKLFVDAMRPAQDKAGVVDFDSVARRVIGLTALDTQAGRDAVKNALEQTRNADGGTDISAAVREAISTLSASTNGRLRVAILLTDGESNFPYDQSLTTQAAQQGIEIHTVGLGSSIDESLLRSIAAGTGGSYQFLQSASDLPALYQKLAGDIIDDGTDTDGDTLTDCVERNGMFVPIISLFPGLIGTNQSSFITTNPLAADTDGDTLPDGGTGGELVPHDLRDNPLIALEYKFLIDAGLTTYYTLRADPRFTDTDGDGYRDDFELAHRMNPLRFDGNELGIPNLDLPPFTLFQPLFVDESLNAHPIVESRWDLTFTPAALIRFNPTPVSWVVQTFDCQRNCDAVRHAAEAMDGGSWCWIPFRHCTSVEERMREVVHAAVVQQGIFDADGSFAKIFVQEQGTVECWQSHATPADCSDPAVRAAAPDSTQLDGEKLDEAISQMLMAIPGGFKPKDLCGGEASRGGTYRLVDQATGEVKYVGQTNDFVRRESEWARDPVMGKYRFERRYHTDNHEAQRGLEQRDYNDLWDDVPIAEAQAKGSLNRQRPMARDRTDYDWRLDIAQTFLDLCL